MSEKEKNKIEKIQLSATTHATVNRNQGTVKIVKEEEVTGKDNLEMAELFSELNNHPIFKGEVDHAYESDFLGYTDKCPRCETATQTMISNFAYATNAKGRIMTGPAGHFCTNCPTVIIDDAIVRSASAGKYQYYGVYSIETGYADKPSLFTTFNGVKPTYVLTLDQDVAGIAQSVHQDEDSILIDPNMLSKLKQQAAIKQQRKKSTNKRKNKNAKKARRRNRKR